MRTDVLIRKVKKEIPKFTECKRCGLCCGPLKLHPLEWFKIKAYIDRKNLWKQVEYLHYITQEVSNHTQVNMKTCHLLLPGKDGAKCLIYPVRPIVCRLQGMKKSLPCRRSPNKNMKITPNIERYYQEVGREGVSLNKMVELTLEERKRTRENNSVSQSE